MTANGAIETFEIERKYQVDGDARLPDAEAFASLGLALTGAERHSLRARYFDTPSGDLAKQRLALRNRHGGNDEGWHLKAKSEDGARELLWPQSPVMPDGLRDEIGVHIGAVNAAAVTVIATLHTERRSVMLCDEAGNAIVELSDDRVDALNELSGRRQRWREWEAELMPGAAVEVLDRVEPLLAECGAKRVRGTSKIQRAMRSGSDHE